MPKVENPWPILVCFGRCDVPFWPRLDMKHLENHCYLAAILGSLGGGKSGYVATG